MPEARIGQQKADADLRALTMMLAEISNNTLGALLRCNVQESQGLPLIHLRREQQQSTVRIDYDRLSFFLERRPQRVATGNSDRHLQEYPLSSVAVQNKPLVLAERPEPFFEDLKLLLGNSRKQQAHAICLRMYNSGSRFKSVRSLANTQRCLGSQRKGAIRLHEAAALAYITDAGAGPDARLLVRNFNRRCEVVTRIGPAFSQANLTTWQFWGSV